MPGSHTAGHDAARAEIAVVAFQPAPSGILIQRLISASQNRNRAFCTTRRHSRERPAPSDVIGGSFLCLLLTNHRNPSARTCVHRQFGRESPRMPSIFLTFRCRHCQQGRCVSAIWWDIRAINELKDRDFSARCPDCGHQDVFFGIEATEICQGSCHLSNEWSWTKKSCGSSDWTKRLKVKNKYGSHFETAKEMTR